MNYVRGFAPWICYAALSAVNWRVGLCVAALAAAALVADQVRRHDLDLLTSVTCGFFVVLAAFSLAKPDSGLNHWMCALAAGTLAVTALVSLAVRRPFTLPIARREVPEEHWGSQLFLRTNMIITSAWAAAFASSAIACALLVHLEPSDGWVLLVPQVAGFVLPFAFTNWYAERVKAAGGRAIAGA